MKIIKTLLITVMCLLLTTSCDKANVLTEFSSQDSDEALAIDAQKAMDQLRWQDAIDIYSVQMSASYRARRDIKNKLASAYAGKCGLLFFDMISGLKNNPSSQMFKLFMGIFAGRTLATASCDQAIDVIQGLGTAGQRTESENLYLTILGIGRIGTLLSSKMDISPSDGELDAVATVCNDGASGDETDGWAADWKAYDNTLFPDAPGGKTAFLTDAEIEKLIVGMGLVFENVAALAASLGGGNSTLTGIDEAQNQCSAAMSGLTNGGVSNCTFAKASDIPPAQKANLIYAFRLILNSTEMGLGTGVIADNVTWMTDLPQYVVDLEAWVDELENDPMAPEPDKPTPGNLSCAATAYPGTPAMPDLGP